jgi:hypothetical protein
MSVLQKEGYLEDGWKEFMSKRSRGLERWRSGWLGGTGVGD